MGKGSHEMDLAKRLSLTGLTPSWKRFIWAPLGITAVRAIVATILYSTLRVEGNFSVPFMNIWKPRLPFDWLYLFSAWDSTFYYQIASQWYPPKLAPTWAFFPLYPTTMKLIALLGIDAELAALIISITCNLACIIIFQQIAERYMDKTQALIATTVYFLFPPIFVFSSATYPESMFLLFSLVSWRLHQQQSDLKASIALALSSLARVEGFLLVIPLLFDFTRQKQFNKIPYLLIPIASAAGWEIYGFSRTGVWLPTRGAWMFWNTLNAQAVKVAVGQLSKGNFSSIAILLPYSWLILTILSTIVIVLFLAWQNARIDKALSIYVLAFAFIIGARLGVEYRSFPRILSFLFPIGLPMHTKKTWLLIVVVLVFLVLDYLAWFAFLTDGFY